MSYLRFLRYILRRNNMSKKIWMRMGVTIDCTDEEADALLSGKDGAEKIIRNIVADGRFKLDGETYIPETCVEDFNQAYGSDYPEDDIEFELNPNEQ